MQTVSTRTELLMQTFQSELAIETFTPSQQSSKFQAIEPLLDGH